MMRLVEAIARAHGGIAQAANRGEGGADVWLSLPAAATNGAAAARLSVDHA